MSSNVEKTLFIPLYGKSFVSNKGIIIEDRKAEEIWSKECFDLKSKSKSKWLAYTMAMRAKVFDNWVNKKLKENKDAIVFHLGCGLDNRVNRVNSRGHLWYDIDLPSVIEKRKDYYSENAEYKMLGIDLMSHKDKLLLKEVPTGETAIIVMEGLNMYLSDAIMGWIYHIFISRFEKVYFLFDVYTPLAVKLSRWQNPINEFGSFRLFGVKNYTDLEKLSVKFVKEHSMTPQHMISELDNVEQIIFKIFFAGTFAKKLYKLYEYEYIK